MENVAQLFGSFDQNIKLIEREQARRERNFSVADAIRDHLRELGVTIEDKPQGPSTWKLE